MNSYNLICLPFLLATTLPLLSMDPVGQRIEINEQYVNTVITIAKQVKHHPVHLQREISNLMQNDKIWNKFLSHPFFAGCLVEQISKKNNSELYPVAIMLNTSGTVQWLKKYVQSHPKKQSEVKDFITMIKNEKIKNKHGKNVSKEYAPFLATLHEIETYIDSLQKRS